MSKYEDLKYYKYTRGDKFQITMSVDENDFVDVVSEIVPDNVDADVLMRFYDDAEKAALQAHIKGKQL